MVLSAAGGGAAHVQRVMHLSEKPLPRLVQWRGLGASALLLLACHPTPAPAPDRCGPAPASAAGMSPAHYGELVGDFTLTQITTNRRTPQPPLVRAIHLYANDSLHRYRYAKPQLGRAPGQRPVAGWVVAPGTDFWGDTAVQSENPEAPGIQWAHGRLRIGKVDVNDGIGDDLTVMAITPEGFWGTWGRDWGIALVVDTNSGQVVPSETGYFCALRLGKRDS